MVDKQENKIVNKHTNNQYTDSIFESIKNLDEYGNEYWYAKKL